MAADLDRAHAFVLAHGDAVEQARLRYVWSGEPVPGALVDALLAGQRADGGWSPFWAPDYSGLDATCFRLAQADQMGVPATDPRIWQALAFLAARQRPDGSWEEDELVRDLAPPWAVPGDPAARLYLTANCGFWLAASEGAWPGATQAAAFLRGHMEENGHLPSFLHAHWLAAGLWLSGGDDEAAERTLAYLATRLDYDTPAGTLSWLITTLDRAGLLPDHLIIQQAAALLILCQATDGHWNSEDGPEQDVHVTLEAIRAFMRLSDLFKILPPEWTGTRSGKDWLKIEEEVGTLLPRDYKDFIDRYGGGEVGGFIGVYGDLRRETFHALDTLRMLRQKYGEQDFPYPFYPERNGLLLWGSTINGDDLFWQLRGDPEQWPIVIKASRDTKFEQHPGPMTSFLAKLLTGLITSEIIPYHAIDQTTLHTIETPIRPSEYDPSV